MPPQHGFDPSRDKWSIDATERLFPPIAKVIFNVSDSGIIYAWHSNIDKLDKDYGVDALLKTQKRNVALAIRIRGVHYYEGFGDITIRYDSLQTLGKKLEMQKSVARFMFYGWGDTNSPGIPRHLIANGTVNKRTIAPPSKLVDWHTVFLQRLIDLYLKKKLRFKGPFNNGDQSSRLVAFDINELNRHSLIYKSNRSINKPQSSYEQPDPFNDFERPDEEIRSNMQENETENVAIQATYEQGKFDF